MQTEYITHLAGVKPVVCSYGAQSNGIWTYWRVSRGSLPRVRRYGCTYGQSKKKIRPMSLKWRHNERDGVSNHLRLFRRKSKKTPKLRVNGFCEGKSSVTGEFPAQRASNAGNVSIWWRHHGKVMGHYVGVIALLLHGLFHLFNVKGRWKVLIILVGGFQWKRDPLLSH